MAPGRASGEERVCTRSADGEQSLHLGTPPSPIPRCTNNSVSMCEALHKHLLACGLFKPACAVLQSSQAVGVSSRAGNSISPSASVLLGANVFLGGWSCFWDPRVRGSAPLLRDAVPCRLSPSCCSAIAHGSRAGWAPPARTVPVVRGWG